jgi:hypothetical protein
VNPELAKATMSLIGKLVAEIISLREQNAELQKTLDLVLAAQKGRMPVTP